MEVTKDLKNYLIKEKGYAYYPTNRVQKEFFEKQNRKSFSYILTEGDEFKREFKTIALVHTEEEFDIIKKDFEEIFKVSHEVTAEECEQVNFFVRQFRRFLKIFGPML